MEQDLSKYGARPLSVEPDQSQGKADLSKYGARPIQPSIEVQRADVQRRIQEGPQLADPTNAEGQGMIPAMLEGAAKGFGNSQVDIAQFGNTGLEQLDSTKGVAEDIKSGIDSTRPYLEQDATAREYPVSESIGRAIGYTTGMIVSPAKLVGLARLMPGLSALGKMMPKFLSGAIRGGIENTIAGGATTPDDPKTGMLIGGGLGMGFGAVGGYVGGRVTEQAAKFEYMKPVYAKLKKQGLSDEAALNVERINAEGLLQAQDEISRTGLKVAKEVMEDTFPTMQKFPNMSPNKAVALRANTNVNQLRAIKDGYYDPLTATTNTVNVAIPPRNVATKTPKAVKAQVNKLDNDIATLESKLMLVELKGSKGSKEAKLSINNKLQELKKEKYGIQIRQKELQKQKLDEVGLETQTEVGRYLPKGEIAKPLNEGEATFSQLQAYRQALDKSIKRANGNGVATDTADALTAHRAYITAKMEQSAQDAGLGDQFTVADNFYSKVYRPMEDMFGLKGISGAKQADKIWDKVNTILESDTPKISDIKGLIRSLDNNGREVIGWAILEKAIQKAARPRGGIDPTRLAQELTKFEASGIDRLVFRPKHKSAKKGLQILAEELEVMQKQSAQEGSLPVISQMDKFLFTQGGFMKFITAVGSSDKGPTMARAFLQRLMERGLPLISKGMEERNKQSGQGAPNNGN